MVYRLSVPLDVAAGIKLEIEHETLQEVCDDFDKLGGDSNWILNAGRATIALSRHGPGAAAVARTLGGEVIAEEDDPFPSSGAAPQEAEESYVAKAMEQSAVPEDDPFAPDVAETSSASTAPTAAVSVSGQRSAIVNGSQIVPPSDPWNTTPDIEEPHVDGCRCGPCKDREWPGEAAVARDALTNRKPSTDDPWGAEAAAAQPVDLSKPVVKHDNYGRRWTFGLPDAPDCDCGEKSARVRGRAKKTQKIYEGWTCARPMSDNWKNKCKYWKAD